MSKKYYRAKRSQSASLCSAVQCGAIGIVGNDIGGYVLVMTGLLLALLAGWKSGRRTGRWDMTRPLSEDGSTDTRLEVDWEKYRSIYTVTPHSWRAFSGSYRMVVYKSDKDEPWSWRITEVTNGASVIAGYSPRRKLAQRVCERALAEIYRKSKEKEEQGDE